MNIDDVIGQLNNHHQRASYGAVAGVLEVTARGLMNARPRDYMNSWVVAKNDDRRHDTRRGWPTGYTHDQIHPECLHQIRQHPDDFIDDENDLRQWLGRYP